MRLSLAFRIFYNSFFAILFIVLLGLSLITPADVIRQAFKNNQKVAPLIVFLCYGGTVGVAVLCYGVQLFRARQALAKIPRPCVEDKDISRKARKMIVASLNRSMAIAWASRPRVSSPQMTAASQEAENATVSGLQDGTMTDTGNKTRRGIFQRRLQDEKEDEKEEEDTSSIPPTLPVWGEITHTGWASPYSPDLPNLQFITVILELPHLIEARAVSLAPPDPNSTSQPPMPDLDVVDILQRPQNMGLRDYVTQLTDLGVISAPFVTASFLSAYEYARFSGHYLTEAQFRALMKQFSDLLRTMKPLSLSILESDSITKATESDIDDDASSTPTEATPSLHSMPSNNSLSRSMSSHTGSRGTVRTAPSRRPGTTGSIRTASRQGEFTTAPATPRSKKRGVLRIPSVNSFAQSRAPYTPGSAAGSSSSSRTRSSSQGSVVRLKVASSSRNGELTEEPYEFNIPTIRS